MNRRLDRLFHSRAHKAGQPPGSLIHVGNRPVQETRMQAAVYDAVDLRQPSVPDAGTTETLRRAGAVAWLDVAGLRDTAVLQRIGGAYGVHPLLLEDILNTDQRPKLEVFEDYVFVVLSSVQYADPAEGQAGGASVEQVSLVLGDGFVLSFSEGTTPMFDAVRQTLTVGKSRLRHSGADYLAYTLIDTIVDGYFPVLERLGERAEVLEDRLLDTVEPSLVHDLQRLKRDLLLLRRRVWPLRDVLGRLARDESPLVRPETAPYLRDIHDHVVEVVDMIEILRDMASGLLEIYLSTVSNRMNEVMKVLTIIATIFIPLTFITSLYGMNFQYMPELHVPWAYPAVVCLCGVIAGAMLLAFKRRGWL